MAAIVSQVARFYRRRLALRPCNFSAILARAGFSPQFAMTCYRYYLQLDEDRNGLLSKAELLQFGRPQMGFPIPVPACALTAVFIDRVFEECCQLFDGEMDYRTFLDFTLAMTYKHRPESLQYCFKVLDIQSKGRLTAFDIQYFFRWARPLANDSSRPAMFSRRCRCVVAGRCWPACTPSPRRGPTRAATTPSPVRGSLRSSRAACRWSAFATRSSTWSEQHLTARGLWFR